jgi:hypothetical protein
MDVGDIEDGAIRTSLPPAFPQSPTEPYGPGVRNFAEGSTAPANVEE